MKTAGLIAAVFWRTTLALVCWMLLPGLALSQLYPFEYNGYAQGTSYHILYCAPDSLVKRKHFDNLFAEIDSSLSVYKPYSRISRFNSSVHGLKIDKHLRMVVEKSLAIFEDSGGLFDITVYPIVRAWGFGTLPVGDFPDSAKIKTLLKCVGSGNIYLKNDSLIKRIPCVQIDVNGIAQGYTVDVLAGFLENKGVVNYLVEVGGEVRVRGYKEPEHRFLRIGVEGPGRSTVDSLSIEKVIELKAGAVTTSGNYRKQLRYGKKNISHLMNPKTGYPLDNEMISATVVAPDAMTADGYDNVLMALGIKEALLFMQRHKEMEAYFIYRLPNGIIEDASTPGFDELVKENP